MSVENEICPWLFQVQHRKENIQKKKQVSYEK